MIAPTHLAFAVACGTLSGAPANSIILLAAGSLLPDADHPQSFVGRVLPFISIPLNKKFGHRRTIHSMFLWGIISLAGFHLWYPIFWLGLGALSHIFIDMLNLSGVNALLPLSQKVCVIFNREFRFPAGSRTELLMLVLISCIAWAGSHINTVGGIRAYVASLTGSPNLAYQRYINQGTTVCYIKGTLRHKDGRMEEGKWLIIGAEGIEKIAIWDAHKSKIIHIPEQAEFLKAELKTTQESWQTISLTGWAKTKSESFFYAGNKWKHAPAQSVVFGWVIGRGELQLEMLE